MSNSYREHGPSTPEQLPPCQPLYKKKRFIVFGAAAAALFIALAYWIRAPKTIDLSKHLSYELTGYNNNGVCELDLDAAALAKEAGRASRKTSRNSGEYLVFNNMYGGEYLIRQLVSAKADKTKGLSNGDTITVTYEIDHKTAKRYGIRFKGDPMTITVQNLEEPRKLDAFKNVRLSFYGKSPYIIVEDVFASQFREEVDGVMVTYVCDKSSELALGDTVTVTVKRDFLPEGVTPLEDSASFPVAGADAYIMDPSELTFAELSGIWARCQERTPIDCSGLYSGIYRTDTADRLKMSGYSADFRNYQLRDNASFYCSTSAEESSMVNRLVLQYEVDVNAPVYAGDTRSEYDGHCHAAYSVGNLTRKADGTLEYEDAYFDKIYSAVSGFYEGENDLRNMLHNEEIRTATYKVYDISMDGSGAPRLKSSGAAGARAR